MSATASAPMKFNPSSFPMPDNAPEPGACVALELLEDGKLAKLTLEPPHREQTVFDGPLMRDLNMRLGELEGMTQVEGLIVTGRSPLHFCYGADVNSIREIESVAQATESARAGQMVFQRLYKLGKRGGGRIMTVAAVGGAVPGGAFEISLACDAIVLTNDKSSKIGLPEVKLGIIPGWGGCTRLPRRVGVPTALEAILKGTLFDARRAKSKGLVDRLAWPQYLDRIAADLAMGRERPKVRERGYKTWAVDKNPAALKLIANAATKGVMAQTGGKYPAALRAIELVTGAPRRSIEEGLHEEAIILGALAVSPECRSLVSLFQGTEDAKKWGKLENGDSAPGFERAAVLGAGVMGGGIASLLARKGLSTRLKDLSRGALDAAVLDHYKGIAKAKKRKRMKPAAADAALDRLEVTTGNAGFGRVDFAIEAISEVLEVKRKVLGGFAKDIRPDAVIASNTSSLSIDAIAEGLPNPERVVGMHFFNPVAQMPLVEVVRGPRSSETAVRRTVKLALDLGKTPVVVADHAGFVVNRLLGPYIDEALRLYESGSSPQELDRLIKDFGMPMGPFVLLDEVGLDIAAHTATSLHEAFGARMQPTELLRPLVEAGELGKKAGKGIFIAPKAGAKKPGRLAMLFGRGGDGPQLNPRLRRSGSAPAVTNLSPEEQLDRMILPMVNEAARALEAGVTETAAELDLATVFGMGFAPFRGGVLAYADALGAKEVLRRLERCSGHADVRNRGDAAERFAPAKLIQAHAEAGTRFREDLRR